ncbi:hypothetical protein BT63DRAFT_484363 [Microthyrium microscopicum]|uniref:Clr5 domain-containing protein n=1 Tax=Microthyrium microscopicum TaxID=703497 RepID=A0A6A6TVR9_9PEZI|nr:hypothetical protein BT63DRAFT_484363 [Microthyrium microscopicum]
MDDYQGHIFQLYIVQKKTLANVILELKDQHGIEVSRSQLLSELKRWEYVRNIKKADALAVLQEKSRREVARKAYDFSIQSRPVDLSRIEQHALRSGFIPESSKHVPQQERHITDMVRVACRTPPPTTSVSLLREEQWRIPEKLIFDVENLVKGSFEAGHWSWNGKDTIIKSSEDQTNEKQLLHGFLGALINGREAADTRDFELAVTCWKRGFKFVDSLVKGQYHDIVPNLIQAINDLSREGQGSVARMLRDHIADCGNTYLQLNSSTKSVYVGLGDLDMTYMAMVEANVMQCFKDRFEFYLGPVSYNSFVMMMNHARRRLYQDDWVRLEDVLPPVDLMDRRYGVSDPRTLDVIGMRIEVAYKRKLLEQVETEAPILIGRAMLIDDDDWQRFYNLTRGWFDLGCAQYFLRKKLSSLNSFDKALMNDDQLKGLGPCNIFDPQRITIAKYRGEMQNWPLTVG